MSGRGEHHARWYIVFALERSADAPTRTVIRRVNQSTFAIRPFTPSEVGMVWAAAASRRAGV